MITLYAQCISRHGLWLKSCIFPPWGSNTWRPHLRSTLDLGKWAVIWQTCPSQKPSFAISITYIYLDLCGWINIGSCRCREKKNTIECLLLDVYIYIVLICQPDEVYSACHSSEKFSRFHNVNILYLFTREACFNSNLGSCSKIQKKVIVATH